MLSPDTHVWDTRQKYRSEYIIETNRFKSTELKWTGIPGDSIKSKEDYIINIGESGNSLEVSKVIDSLSVKNILPMNCLYYDKSNNLYNYNEEKDRDNTTFKTENIQKYELERELIGLPEIETIKYLVNNYKIGNTIEILNHNSIIAKKVNRNDISECWNILTSIIPLKCEIFNEKERLDLIKELILFYIEESDIFHYIFIVLCFQDYCLKIFSKEILQNWYSEFIDLLRSLNLHTEATRMCSLEIEPNLFARSHDHEQSSRIDQVKGDTTCIFCHLPVIGIYIWCSVCHHGGHMKHFNIWFENNERCPECDHVCKNITKIKS